MARSSASGSATPGRYLALTRAPAIAGACAASRAQQRHAQVIAARKVHGQRRAPRPGADDRDRMGHAEVAPAAASRYSPNTCVIRTKPDCPSRCRTLTQPGLAVVVAPARRLRELEQHVLLGAERRAARPRRDSRGLPPSERGRPASACRRGCASRPSRSCRRRRGPWSSPRPARSPRAACRARARTAAAPWPTARRRARSRRRPSTGTRSPRPLPAPSASANAAMPETPAQRAASPSSDRAIAAARSAALS